MALHCSRGLKKKQTFIPIEFQTTTNQISKIFFSFLTWHERSIHLLTLFFFFSKGNEELTARSLQLSWFEIARSKREQLRKVCNLLLPLLYYYILPGWGLEVRTLEVVHTLHGSPLSKQKHCTLARRWQHNDSLAKIQELPEGWKRLDSNKVHRSMPLQQ